MVVVTVGRGGARHHGREGGVPLYQRVDRIPEHMGPRKLPLHPQQPRPRASPPSLTATPHRTEIHRQPPPEHNHSPQYYIPPNLYISQHDKPPALPLYSNPPQTTTHSFLLSGQTN